MMAHLLASGPPKDYDPEGKHDPFKPLPWLFTVEPDSPEPDPGPAECPEWIRPRRLTPLEHIHLSQLKLTGIIRGEYGNRALLRDASGRPFIVAKGTKVGTDGGKIAAISKDRIFIEEEYMDEQCDISVRSRELEFRKPPGE